MSEQISKLPIIKFVVFEYKKEHQHIEQKKKYKHDKLFVFFLILE